MNPEIGNIKLIRISCDNSIALIRFAMPFEPISYISKILWRFYGGSTPSDPSIGLKDIQYIFREDKIRLEPYYGLTGYNRSYNRQIVNLDLSKRSDMVPGDQGEPEGEENLVYAEEPKSVCYCDIPINHLALHMKKYNQVGIGIDRDLLAKKAEDLQPVRYYFIREPNISGSVPGVFTFERNETSSTIKLDKYVKIPTLFNGDSVAPGTHQPEDSSLAVSEGFNSIYEEREWRHFDPIELDYSDISFLLLPSRSWKEELENLDKLFNAKVGVIYANELFPVGEQ